MQSRKDLTCQKDRTVMTLAIGTISSILFLGAISSMSTNIFAAKFTANMSGGNEVPPVDTKAIGKTTFRTANNGTTIKYKVNITGFSDATGAHIHVGKVGVNGDIAVDLLKGSKKNPTRLGLAIRGNITDSSLTGPMKGKTLAYLVSAINSGDTYVNVHTPAHPDGEIRGQIESGGGNATTNTNTTASDNVTDFGSPSVG